MNVHVFSAGQSPKHDYNLGEIRSSVIENAIQAVERAGLTLNEDSEELTFVFRYADTYVVFLNNLLAFEESARPLDYQKRFIRVSVAWAVSSEREARGLFQRCLDSFRRRSTAKEDVFAALVLECIHWDKVLPNGYEWDSDQLEKLARDSATSSEGDSSLSARRDILSTANCETLVEELALKQFPTNRKEFICVVANQTAKPAFTDARVWYSLMLGYETKKSEASTMPGEFHFSPRKFLTLGASVIVLLVGFAMIMDRTPPKLVDVRSHVVREGDERKTVVLTAADESTAIGFLFDEPITSEIIFDAPDWVKVSLSSKPRPPNELLVDLHINKNAWGKKPQESTLQLQGVRDKAGNKALPPTVRIRIESSVPMTTDEVVP